MTAASNLTDEGWIEWHGGENPVPGARVEAKYRKGKNHSAESNWLSWAHPWSSEGDEQDIIAYRVVTPAVLFAIEGGGGSSAAPIPTEQADGGVVVPREPTRAMLDAGWPHISPAAMWSAMIEARPCAIPVSGHDRHLVEVDFPNGMRLTIVREDDYDAVTIWSEDGESIFTQAEVFTPPATPIAGGDRWAELERLAKAAKAARDAYDADDDGPDALELSISADEALEALDRAAQPYRNLILELIAAARRDEGAA